MAADALDCYMGPKLPQAQLNARGLLLVCVFGELNESSWTLASVPFFSPAMARLAPSHALGSSDAPSE